MKLKETLEEAAERIVIESNIPYDFSNELIKMAKWQQERMYSEEDLKEAFIEGSSNSKGLEFGEDRFTEWFEQLK